MANYSTDFSEYSTGSIPSDWTARWDATTQFTVKTGGADQILKAEIAAANRYACTWNDVDSDANRDNAEVLTKFRVLSVAAGDYHGGVVVRASGTGTTEAGYFVTVYENDLIVAKYVSATYTLIATQALTLLANTDYWLRFRVNGTSIKARIWLSIDSEPGTWGIDTTDTSISAAGWTGVYARSAAGDPEFDAIAIATNGDTASIGGSTTIETTPVVFQWETTSGSFYQTLESITGNWTWNDQTASLKTTLETSPIAFQWEITTGELLGTTSVDGNPIGWQWEITAGSLSYIVPTQESRTIGGKKNKKVKLPYYETKDFKTNIEFEDIAPVKQVEKKVQKEIKQAEKSIIEEIAKVKNQQPILADIIAKTNIVTITPSIEIIVDEELYDENEEVAVIMLLLAA